MRLPLTLVFAAALAACSDESPGALQEFHFLSRTYDVDGLYRSMMGPRSREYVNLLPNDGPPELVWVTGFRAVMVGADGEIAMPQDFMCHSNFSLQQPYVRLFTLSQGQLTIEFPPGFAVPIMSDDILSVETQVLNLNEPDTLRQVRHKIDVTFVRDADLERPMHPLAVKAGYALVSLDEDPVIWEVETAEGLEKRVCCLPGEAASMDSMMTDAAGRRMSGHFVVPPGRHEYRTPITGQMRLQHDTRAHYIAVHVHPFAEYAELHDVTSGETVYRSRAEQFEDRIGLKSVEYYSSTEGLPLFKDHEYEIVGVYDNTSGAPQDAMVVLLLYVENEDFVKPAPGAARPKADRIVPSPDVAPGKIVLETLVEGFGAVPAPGDPVVVHYSGWLANGVRFESTYARGMPFSFLFGAGSVVPGLEQAIGRMRVGGTAKVTIPSDLGFGARGAGEGTIPPNATLVFEVELLDVPSVGIEVLRTGQGPEIQSGQTAVVQYRGWLADGTEFDSSHRRGKPWSFRLGTGQVITGWHAGVAGMRVGEMRRVHVPAALAYGPKGFGTSVPPNADLLFELELVGIQ